MQKVYIINGKPYCPITDLAVHKEEIQTFADGRAKYGYKTEFIETYVIWNGKKQKRWIACIPKKESDAIEKKGTSQSRRKLYPKVCRVVDCDKPHHSKGYCKHHYELRRTAAARQ